MTHAQPSFEDLLEALYAATVEPARFEEFTVGLRSATDSRAVVIQTDDGSNILSMAPVGTVTTLNVSRDRHQQPYGKDELQLLRRLLPHLRNVSAIQQQMASLMHIASSLDCLETAICLLDDNGRILRVNPAAESILEDRHTGIRHSNGRLSATWRASRPLLDAAINGALGPRSKSASAVLLHSDDGRPWGICRIHPVHPVSLGDWMVPATAGIAVLLHPLAPSAEVAQDLLRQAFGLTPAEARLAQALLRHGSLAACRSALHKSHETLRTQLKSLFVKTGTRRQSELLLKLQELAA
jgi:DNA-binding CsgD family transcriptional regulator/PAS domain-containing protein